ncbi:hypothetical protein [Halosolutus halophilus]|uniref:hypothetical protein n=1 Tax=Halosolutus halophilus TaxID=1552990 RepID=UPI002234F982|nr:hypothetical protein [Halosolutus halophilus]
MSSAYLTESSPVAYVIVLGIALVAIVVGSLIFTLLLGIPLIALLQTIAGAASLGITLFFLYLFYRLVLAIERISRKL